MFVPELQEHQDEIRVGLWEDGEFVEVYMIGVVGEWGRCLSGLRSG